MNDADRMLLTTEMGECWHEKLTLVENATLGGSFRADCKRCGEIFWDGLAFANQRRTFTTPDDFFVVWEWAKKREWWPWFIVAQDGKADRWSLVDPIRFPQLVADFLRERG